MANELWAVSIEGPDSLFAMPSREVADERAAKWNAMIDASYRRVPADIDEMRAQAVVIPWPSSAESHASSLAHYGDDPEDIC